MAKKYYYGLFMLDKHLVIHKPNQTIKKAVISNTKREFVRLKLSLEKEGFKLIKRTKLHGA